MTGTGAATSHEDAVQELFRRVAALEREMASMRGESGKDGSGPSAPVVAPPGLQLLERVWYASPLGARLEFLRTLGPGNSLDAALQEAVRLLRSLEDRGNVEAWIREYPSVFADTLSAIEATPQPVPTNDVEVLIDRTMGEARHQLETQVRLLGVEWIEPAPGDAITELHSVVEEMAAPGTAPGRVSACRRRGFRWNGKVHLPALIARQPAAGAMTQSGAPDSPHVTAEAAVPREPVEAATTSAGSASGAATAFAPASGSTVATSPSAGQEQPPWLISLQRSIPDGDRTTAGALTRGLADLVTRLNAGGSEVPDYEITVALKPLLALLGTGAGVWRPDLPNAWTDVFQRGRPELLAWLAEHLSLEIFVPAVGEPFSLTTMQMTAERRTAHPHEWGTVARVEAPGLLRGGQVLLPARVVRYESGDGA